jgi:hypothetical protein
MGYIRHDAIIATSAHRPDLASAQRKARRLGLTCTAIVASPLNGYVSFLIVPDGSKEGWGDSEEGDSARAEWIEWISEEEDEEGMGFKRHVDWAHVSFGGDEPENARLVAANQKQL